MASLQYIARTLVEARDVLVEAVQDLVIRDQRLRALELRSRELGEQGEELQVQAQRLEARRKCGLATVVLVALIACFLLLVALSYATQRQK